MNTRTNLQRIITKEVDGVPVEWLLPPADPELVRIQRERRRIKKLLRSRRRFDVTRLANGRYQFGLSTITQAELDRLSRGQVVVIWNAE
ncbi:MAG: hypothetical protein AB1649_03410 [Chloroflexota bacterium]